MILLRGEPILRTVIGDPARRGRTWLRIWSYALPFPVVISAIAILVDHNWRLPESGRGLLQDWDMWALFATLPVEFSLLALVARRFERFLATVDRQSAAVGSYAPSHALIQDLFPARGRWRLLRFLAMALGICYVIWNAYNRYSRWNTVYFDPFWTSSQYPLSFWVTTAYTMVLWGYVLPVIACKLVMTVTVVARFSRRLEDGWRLQLEVLSSDGVGGLGSLGELALAMSYMVVPLQVHAVLYYFWIGHVNQPFLVNITAAAAVTVGMFFAPTLLAHRAMKEAKTALLDAIAGHYNDALARTLNDGARPRTASGAELRRWHDIHAHVQRIGAWPFDVTVLVRLLIAVGGPTATAIVKSALFGPS